MAKKKKDVGKVVKGASKVAKDVVDVVPSAVPKFVRRKENVGKIITDIEKEMSKVVVGQHDVIHSILRAILCNGHVLVEGVPGVAKTLIVRSVAKILGCDMKRIQFTVDLLPTDITGIMSYVPQKGFSIMKGPVFTNFILADEINRSPPKTQSALLEAMQERTVTIARETYPLPNPFFVMATENPLEVSGVYSLPEAQIDRFLFKVLIDYPKHDEEKKILRNNITMNEFESYDLKAVLNAGRILNLQAQVKDVFTSEAVEEYIVNIVDETRDKTGEFGKYVSYGASPRASISLYIASKAEALMKGRDYVVPEDVQTVVYPVLRHRIILNYEAEAEDITTDKVIKHILGKINAP